MIDSRNSASQPSGDVARDELDLRERLTADVDGKHAHELVLELARSSRDEEQRSQAMTDRAMAQRHADYSRAFMLAAHVVETVAPRLAGRG